MVRLVKNLPLVFFVALLSSCANIQAPGGGEIDTTPPEIVEVYPANKMTNFKEKEIEFTFSEYVDKRTFKDAIFVSPALDKGFDVSWSGKTATIVFKEELKPNVTYNLTIGTSVVDLNNSNTMAQAFSYIFSTGDQIDEGVIRGKVYDKDPNKLYIFAYMLGNENDSLLKRKPDFVTQIGTSGEFVLSGLPAGNFRVFAVGNSFGDLIYNLNTDRIGIYNKDITLGVNDTLKEYMRFRVTKFDTIPPILQKGVMTDEAHIVLSFNEEIDVNSVSLEKINIIDTTGSGGDLSPVYLYHPGGKVTELAVAVSGDVKEESAFRLEIEGVKDKAGNSSGLLSTEFQGTVKKDTIPPSIGGIDPSDLKNVQPDFPEFKIRFDDAISFQELKNAVVVSDTSGKVIPSALSKIDDAFYKLNVNATLESANEYRLKINASNLRDAAGNSRDTLLTTNFTTYNTSNYTGLTGNIDGIADGNYILELYDPSAANKVYKVKADKDGNFEFKDVLPGKYKLWVYEDLKNNKEFFYGSLFPFTHSAKFFEYPEEIELITRWITFDFKWSIR